MNLPHIGLAELAVLAEILAVFATGIMLTRRRAFSVGRRGVVLFGLFWVIFVTAEYWALGPYSHVYVNDEGEGALGVFKYLATVHDGGRFAHGLGGGSDASSYFSEGNPFFSLEVFLFRILPPWLAVAIHKILTVTTSFAGAYLLARRATGSSRLDALGLAAAYSLSFSYLLLASLPNGIGFAWIPLAVYLLVYRLEKPNYAKGALVFALAHAASMSPMFSAQALGAAVVIAWLGRGAPKPGLLFFGLGVVALAALANWSDVVSATALNAPASYRLGRDLSLDLQGLVLLSARNFLGTSMEIAIIVLASLFLLARRDRGLLFRPLLLLAASAAIGPAVKALVPWERIGLGFLKSFEFNYLSLSLPTLAILVGGWAAKAAGSPVVDSPAWRLARPAVLCLSIAVGLAAWHKVFNFGQWLIVGGISPYANVPNLARPDWAPDRPFRVATVPYRLNPNMVAAYGLESFDGFSTLFPKNRGLYWRYAVAHSDYGLNTGLTYIAFANRMDFLCCSEYDAEKFFDLAALRAGNVEFLISVLPLSGGGLAPVSAPPVGMAPPRRTDSPAAKIRGFLSFIFDPPAAYIYRLADPLPRAFMAREIAVMPEPERGQEETYYRALVRHALERRAVVAPDVAAGLPSNPAGSPEATVKAIKRVRDGYDLTIRAPAGGLLMVNTPWNPFWRAFTDTGAEPLPVFEGNGIHTGIVVPAGAAEIRLRYARPRPTDIL